MTHATRTFSSRASACAATLLCASLTFAAGPARAAAVDFEIVPFVGYRAGGSFRDTAIAANRDVREHASFGVALSVTATDNPYRAYMLRGHVSAQTTEGADAHIDWLSKKYLGLDRYPRRTSGEVRVIFRIAVDAIASMD